MVFKLGELAQEGQADRANGAITLFCNNDLSHTFVWRVGPIDLVSVNKQNDVCILLDCSGFAKITHYRTLIGPLLDSPV